MRTLAKFVLVGAVVVLTACGTVKNTTSDGDDRALMLRGNDPVAYQTQNQAMQGNPAIKADHDGVTYRFVSEANKAEFQRQPNRYVPAYAGFCASGAPYALKAAIGAQTFKVVDGRLYLYGGPRSRLGWELDEKKNIEIGDNYWETEMKDVPSRWQNFKRYTFRVPHYKSDADLAAEYQKRYGKPMP